MFSSTNGSALLPGEIRGAANGFDHVSAGQRGTFDTHQKDVRSKFSWHIETA